MGNFLEDRLESVLYHMFGASVVQEGYYVRPFLTVLTHGLEKDSVLLVCPLSVFDGFVEVVLPSLPTLFWSLEEVPSGFDVEVFGNFVPLTFGEFAESGQSYWYASVRRVSSSFFQEVRPLVLMMLRS